MEPDDDAATVGRVMSGDTEAFALIVQRNQRRLYAFGRRFFADLHDIEDFVQDVFLQAFRKLDTFRAESKFSSWLLTIAYHIAVREKKRQPRFDAIEADISDRRRGDPETIALRRETGMLIIKAMRELPGRFATCLDLHFFFGQTYEEISTTTGHPVNTVRSHVRRAKALLRPVLMDQLSEGSHGMS
jgi:RNA polymerase sigma-70 factor (ECF subfamily)